MFLNHSVLIPSSAPFMDAVASVTLPPPASFIANKIISAFVAGDYKEAARLQLQFALFPARWMDAGLATVMKAAMTKLGVPCGAPYPPYPPLSDDRLAQVEAFLAISDFKPAKSAI
jgi:4-hydroxy-tetrahydrodipicolinate synthase